MSGFLSNLFPFKVVRIGGLDDNTNSTNRIIGMNGSYKANQADKTMPFDDAYASSSDVYSIVNKISRNGKSIPWKLKVKKGENIDDVESGYIYDLINRPNSTQSFSEFVEQALNHILLSGNIYMYNDVPFGLTGSLRKTTEIINLHPQLTEIVNKFSRFVNLPDKYVYHLNGKENSIDPADIVHSVYVNPTTYGINTLYGLSPMVAGYLTLTGLVHNQTAHASILDNMGAAGILSNESDAILTPDERDEQQSLFDKKNSGAAKFGKIVQSMSRVKYTKLGLDPTQLQIIEGKALKMRDLCNIYDISSVLFNDPKNRIQANLVPAETAMWKNAIIPNVRIVVDGFTRSIIRSQNTEKEQYYIELDESKISALQKDGLQKAKKGKTVAEIVIAVLSSALTDEQKALTLVKSLEINYDEAMQIVRG